MQTQEKPTIEPGDKLPSQDSLLYKLKNVTPVRLAFLLFVIILLCGIFCAFSVTTIRQHEFAVKTVGIDTTPSVIAAYQIKSAVLAMDTDLADELLYRPNVPESHDEEADYERWRVIACKQLVAAAKNITYPGELVPIENIQIALGKYAMQTQQARDLHSAGESAESIKVYRAAFETVHNDLLPNLAALEKEDSTMLESSYNQEKSASNLSRGFLLVLGLFLVFALVVTQYYLFSRFHRRFSLPLLLALLSLAVLLPHLNNSLTLNANYLKVAKEDSYDSVLALLVTRANAFNASASASRALLDRDHADEYKKIYSESITKIAGFEGNHNMDEIIDTVQKQIDKNQHINAQGFTGSLADELNNVCYPGESNLVLDTMRAFAMYCQQEWKVSELQESGAHDEAVRMCISYSPEGSKYPFTKFDDALMQTLRINQVRMESAMKSAFTSLEGLAVQTMIVCAITIVCAYLALMPRMDEYVRCKTNY